MTRPPNIVLMNCDDLGYGDLGCYGSATNATPALDKMASEGVRFTDFVMASSVCSPSRASMLTGCYPPRIGFGTFEGKWVLFPGQPVGLNPSEITIARLLKDRGYRTQLVGKWHCGDQPPFLPRAHGFDGYYGVPYSNDMGVQVGAEPFPPLPLLCDSDVIESQPDQASLTERYVGEAVRFIRSNVERPFFLYFAHMYVHRPLYVPETFMRASRNGAYGAAVAAIDWATGVILQELAMHGLDESTIVLFTSDNGSRARNEGGSNSPLRGTKGTAFEGGHRVPLIARWPGHIPAGRTSNASACSVDLLPTIANLTGTAVPSDRIIDGIDISDLLRSPDGTGPRNRSIPYYLRDDLQAIRYGEWKLHVARNETPVRELYNLALDVGESINLYESRRDIVSVMMSLADTWREDLGDSVTGTAGCGIRPKGRVDNPAPLTGAEATHPYIVAMYDLEDRG